MTDPRVLSVISCVFALMAAYSLYTGTRQLRDARRAGHPLRWYKHLGMLTGIEYTLLTFVFLLRTTSLQDTIAPNMKGLVGILYLILLIPAAIIAGLVIRRVILNMRATGQTQRAQARGTTGAQTAVVADERVLSKQAKDDQAQRQRARRKKAAAARRRQAGKA